MSVELVNRFSIKKDGVYINTHSNNDTSPFHSVKLNHISELYLYRNSETISKWHALKEFINKFSWYESLRTHGNDEQTLLIENSIKYAQEKYNTKTINDNLYNCVFVNNTNETNLIVSELYDNLCKTLSKFVYERAAVYYVLNGGSKKWGINLDELKNKYNNQYWEI